MLRRIIEWRATSVLQTCLVLVCILSVSALSSPECLKAIKADQHMKAGVCRPSCGSLRLPADGRTFLGRLSTECSALMQQYRRPGVDSGSKCGFTDHEGVECPNLKSMSRAAQVNIVQAENAHPFAMCTIAKSGCTHLRKLLRAIMLYPEPLLNDETAS